MESYTKISGSFDKKYIQIFFFYKNKNKSWPDAFSVVGQ